MMKNRKRPSGRETDRLSKHKWKLAKQQNQLWSFRSRFHLSNQSNRAVICLHTNTSCFHREQESPVTGRSRMQLIPQVKERKEREALSGNSRVQLHKTHTHTQSSDVCPKLMIQRQRTIWKNTCRKQICKSDCENLVFSWWTVVPKQWLVALDVLKFKSGGGKISHTCFSH